MKKAITILNQYLSHFWFTLFLLITGSLFFSYSHYLIVNYYDLNIVEWLINFFSGFYLLFLVPLGIFSVVIALFIWLKNKDENSYQGWVALIWVLLTISSSFMFIARMQVVIGDVRIHQNLIESEVILKNAQMNKLK